MWGTFWEAAEKGLLWCRKCNNKVFLWQSILYFIPENADRSFSPCLKYASSIIQIPIFKPCFGKCILCGTCVIHYALLSAVIVYNTPQSSTGWRHIYYRQWCQCWSVLIGHFKTKARQKGICFQWLVRLVLEVSSWCFSPYVGIQLPVLRGPFHWGPPPQKSCCGLRLILALTCLPQVVQANLHTESLEPYKWYTVKTSKSVKMSHIFQVTIPILRDCFALHSPGHAGNSNV